MAEARVCSRSSPGWLRKQASTFAADYAGFAGSLLGQDAEDLGAYVTQKALDGLFMKIAKEEKRIRENPLARTLNWLAQKCSARWKDEGPSRSSIPL